jgi:PAS domain S-box-containing protein
MERELHILILEDVATDAELMERELRKAGMVFSSRRVETKKAFIKGLKDFAPDLILADYTLPMFDGLSALAIVQEKCPDIPFILVSGAIGEELAIEAIKSGATDYILKQRLSRLGHTVHRALREVEERAERRRAEEALKESEEQLRTVFEASLDAIIAVNDQGKIVLLNPAAEELFLYSSEDVLNKPIKILFRENTGGAHQMRLERFLSIGMGQCGHIGRRLERIFRRKDGTTFEAEVAMAGGRRDDKRLIVVSIHDVTERKQAEEALEQLKRQNELILQSAGEGILGLDLEGKQTLVNPAAARMLGYKIEELIGQPSHMMWHHSKPDGIPYPNEECPINAAYKDGTIHSRDNEVFWRKDGTSFPVRYTSTPIREGDKLIGAVVIFHDITDRKKMEKELKERVKELEDFYKMGIGRELKMIELKEEIESLKEELGKYKKPG